MGQVKAHMEQHHCGGQPAGIKSVDFLILSCAVASKAWHTMWRKSSTAHQHSSNSTAQLLLLAGFVGFVAVVESVHRRYCLLGASLVKEEVVNQHRPNLRRNFRDSSETLLATWALILILVRKRALRSLSLIHI